MAGTIINLETGETFGVSLPDLDIVQNHLHNTNQCFGITSNNLAKNAVTALALTGGSGAWGTELQINDGTAIESGSATKKFDIGKIIIPTIGTANRNTLCEIFYGSKGTAVTAAFLNTGDTLTAIGVAIAATTQDAGDTLTRAGNCPANDTRVVLSSIVGSTGISNDVLYYVVNSTVGTTNTTFQLSLTSGGGAVAITTDGSCNFHIAAVHGRSNGDKIMLSAGGGSLPAEWNNYTTYYVVSATTYTFQVSLTSGGAAVTCASAGQCAYQLSTQTSLTSFYVVSATTTPQQLEVNVPCPRIPCNSILWIRAWSSGGTNALGMLFNLHTYNN